MSHKKSHSPKRRRKAKAMVNHPAPTWTMDYFGIPYEMLKHRM